MLSVIVPSFDSAATLGPVLAAVRDQDAIECEIIVADGGSTDATPDIAAQFGARLLSTGQGRGHQLAAGAEASRQDWLLFLHADTVLAPGWDAAAAGFMAEAGNLFRFAAFRFALDDSAPQARWLEAMVAWRCRAFGLPYGDQGLLVSRMLYDAQGGFRAMPLMEDVDLIRRLGRDRLVMVNAKAVTSAARFRRGGYFRRSIRNLFCLALYLVGLPPRAIVRLYG